MILYLLKLVQAFSKGEERGAQIWDVPEQYSCKIRGVLGVLRLRDEEEFR